MEEITSSISLRKAVFTITDFFYGVCVHCEPLNPFLAEVLCVREKDKKMTENGSFV